MHELFTMCHLGSGAQDLLCRAKITDGSFSACSVQQSLAQVFRIAADELQQAFRKRRR